MADKYLTPTLTTNGLAMVAKAIYGDSITFTEIRLGNGTPPDLDNVTEMANTCLSIQIVEFTKGDDYVLLTGETDSSQIVSSFYGNELGIIAKDETDTEYLYAYRWTENADFFPASSEGRTIELRLSVAIAIGSAENVTAILTAGEEYATKASFNAHLEDYNNPHRVTAEQVGLGNVANEAPENLTPTFTPASARTNIVSGDTFSVILGKISKVISDFTSHLTAKNPHSITAAGISASAVGHKHAASDITSGILSVERGGTGSNSILGAINNLLKNGASGIAGVIQFANSGNSSNTFRGIMGTMGLNDYFRVGCYATAQDTGVLEFATEDNGNEIHIHRQYGRSTSQGQSYETPWNYVVHQAYILNEAGNTVLSGTCTATKFITSSDRKLKKNVEEVDSSFARDLVMGLTPVTYNFKEDDRKKNYGFIAQDVYSVLHKDLDEKNSAIYNVDMIPKDENDIRYKTNLMDSEIEACSDSETSWNIDYQQLISPMIRVIQDQEIRIKELEDTIRKRGN